MDQSSLLYIIEPRTQRLNSNVKNATYIIYIYVYIYISRMQRLKPNVKTLYIYVCIYVYATCNVHYSIV